MPRDMAAAFKALFVRLSALDVFETSSRDWPQDLTTWSSLPSMHLTSEGMEHANTPGLPARSTLRAHVGVFVKHTTDSETADAILAISAAIKGALRLQEGEAGDYHTTLGDLVEWAWVTREEIAEGAIGGSGLGGMDLWIEMLAVEDD